MNVCSYSSGGTVGFMKAVAGMGSQHPVAQLRLAR